MQDLKLVGLKSHDCHILMQQLLPVAIRGILPKNVRQTITRLCAFFSSICSKVIDPLKLDELQAEIVIILCQLEMFFPPSFLDIMVHLLVHVVREIKFCGPVYLRWMYPIERYMKILKGYVKNQYRPKASMIERYIALIVIQIFRKWLDKIKLLLRVRLLTYLHFLLVKIILSGKSGCKSFWSLLIEVFGILF